MNQMSLLEKFSVVETPTTSNFATIDDEKSSQLGLMSNILLETYTNT